MADPIYHKLSLYQSVSSFSSFCLRSTSSNSPIITLPDDKNLELAKLKVVADDKIKFGQTDDFCPCLSGNIVGKSRKCWLPAFQQWFQK